MRVVKLVVGLLVVGGLPGLAACTSTGDIEVTTTADVVADDGLTSLREAFLRANARATPNRIVLGGFTTYDLTDCAAGALVHTTASVLTIEGDGGAIRQTCPAERILASTHPASSLVVHRTHLIGGPNPAGVTYRGAAVDVRGSLVLHHLDVTGVDAGPGGTVIDGNTGGPQADDIAMDETTVVGNVGTAISIRDGGVRILFARVAGNTGDGIELLGTSTFWSGHGTIEDNAGWGVDARGSGDTRVEILASRVDGNARGGISCSGCADLSVEETSVGDNGAGALPGSGGGISFVAEAGGPDDDARLHLRETFVIGNRAQRAGGGVFAGRSDTSYPADGSPAVHLNTATITANTTLGSGQPGGGLAVTAGRVLIGASRFAANTAGGDSDGGGLFVATGDRSAAGAWLDRATTFDSNHAGGDGGGASIATGGGAAIDARFSDNTAAGNGGGLSVAVPGRLTLGSDFLENAAVGRGGGADVRADTEVRAARYRGNQAADGGGAFVALPGPEADLTVVGSTFAGNTVSGQGGGLVANGGNRVELINSTVAGNTASRGGGLSILDEPPGGLERAGLTYTTVAGNSAPVGANVAADVRLQTLFALVVEPLGGGTGCAVAATDQAPAGYSFVSDASCGVHPTDTVFPGDPLLGPLADDGTSPPVLVRRPAPASPIGATVPVVECAGTVDQGGRSRPQGAACEPGAVEIVETG